jgi:hypothetical protein
MNKTKRIIVLVLVVVAFILHKTVFDFEFKPDNKIEYTLHLLFDAGLGFIYGWNLGGLLRKKTL